MNTVADAVKALKALDRAALPRATNRPVIAKAGGQSEDRPTITLQRVGPDRYA